MLAFARHSSATLAALGLSLLFAACSDAPAPLAPADAPLAAKGGNGGSGSGGLRGRLFFTGSFDPQSNSDIYVMNADGTGLTALTDNTLHETEPSATPDGRRVAFVRLADVQMGEIWVMNGDGTGQVKVADMPGIKHNPAISPDGRRIVFENTPQPGLLETFVVNVDGSDLLPLPDPLFGDLRNVSWSPRGDRLVFTSDREGNGEVYTMNPDGSALTRVTVTETFTERDPVFSPDGKRIAFISVGSLWVMNADGTNRTRLTFAPALELRRPTWAPGGRQIAVDVTYDSVNRQVAVVNADGSGVVTAIAPERTAEANWVK